MAQNKMNDKLLDYVIRELFKRVLNRETLKNYITETETGYQVKFEVEENFDVEDIKDSILSAALAAQGISLEDFDSIRKVTKE